MNKIASFSKWPLWLAVIGMMLTALPGLGTTSPVLGQATGASNPPPFDFSDGFYSANGINPSTILNRSGSFDANGNPIRPGEWVLDPSNTDPDRRGVRELETTGGFDNSGNLIYYSIFGMVDKNTFERDANGNLTAAGQHALDLANQFRAFLFPKRQADGSSILSPALPNRRQDNVFDTRDGYFSNNPLGLWILTFVAYTPKAFTDEGRAVLDPIAAVNGRDLDGTPILNSASLIDNLASQGLVELLKRDPNGTGPNFPWVI